MHCFSLFDADSLENLRFTYAKMKGSDKRLCFYFLKCAIDLPYTPEISSLESSSLAVKPSYFFAGSDEKYGKQILCWPYC